jgi:riboflavin kinase/FMN adenylyltransferase
MVIHHGYENLNLFATVATLGIFDGVHRGHIALIERLVERAHELQGESAVITFSPHPRLVLDPLNTNISFLTSMEEKITLLENAKIEHLIIIHFTEQFSQMRACDFIRDILVKKISTKHLVIGYDHHFGRKGEGDFNTIKQCSEDNNLTVEQAQGFQTEEGAISSSLIREALLKGKIDEANRWLGYNYTISGTVVEGRRIGRTIGFPTANIKPDFRYKLIPGNGVYAVEVKTDNEIYPGMMSIGSNPTVNSDASFRSIEVHILNFEKDIYGGNISVSFRKRLRDEKKFNSLTELTDQMRLDKVDTLRLLT